MAAKKSSGPKRKMVKHSGSKDGMDVKKTSYRYVGPATNKKTGETFAAYAKTAPKKTGYR